MLGRQGAIFRAALAVLVFGVVAAIGIGVSPAQGDETNGATESLAPTAAQTKEFLESGKAEPLVGKPETDLGAAETMPHRDLERGEALELAEAVFEPELEAAAGVYGELEPERFVSDYAAVVPASSLAEEPDHSGEGLAAEHPARPVLLESTLPLRTEGESGHEEAVNLSLERSEGELQPQNPLAEVGIPDQLGEGISLPGPELDITVAGAPEGRAPTDASGEFAFYPEVAENTDLIVSPTPRGVETMTSIRSSEAPMETTYDLAIPTDAELRATSEGGAEVVEGGRATAVIPPPSALDADGNQVQAELTVEGDAVKVLATPNPSTNFPILVDPNVITEGWRWTLNHDSLAAWSGNTSNASAMQPVPYELWASQFPGLDLSSGIGGNAASGTQANWEYWEPRYREDMADFGVPPSTWLWQMTTEGIQFHEYGNNSNYPALVFGLVDPRIGWQSSKYYYGGEGELTDWNRQYYAQNSTAQPWDKGADMNMVTYEAEAPSKRRDIYLANAYIAVVDETLPEIAHLTKPQHWVNTVAEPISFLFIDTGLGVRSAGISFNGTAEPGWGFDFGCSGTTASPCPRVASSAPEKAGEAKNTLAYYPASLPTGEDRLTVTVGNVFWGLGGENDTESSLVTVKVDHAAPEVTLSGPLTEQPGSLGTSRPSYALRVTAKDGVAGAPQSGIKKVEVLVDGKKVAMPEEAEWEPNCQTENCPVNAEWTMNASEYGVGAHEVKVIATDAVGNSTTKTLHVELHPTPPTLSVSGTLTEQAKLGSERPSYKLAINASTPTASPVPATIPSWSSSFGSAGSGNGQFSRPGAMAVDGQGNLWVVDSNDNRVEKFNEGGGYLSQIKPEASSKCALSRPTAVAINAAGNLWVTDSGHKRVVELSPAGACLGEFGGAGLTGGKFAGSGPEAIAIDYHGNIWVADTYGGRLEKFNENGVFVRSVATKGKGPEQLGQPDGIAIAPGGNVFVTDWEDDKVVEYGEGGKFIRQFGSQGSEPGQLQNPTGITVDSRGDVWVPDQNNGRVEEFNQGGEYLGSFGAEGPGAWQFELSYPTGIATDAKGDLWVTNAGRDQVEKWVSANYLSSVTPTYLSSFGTAGNTVGHFTAPQGLAVGAQGRVWVDDLTTDLVQSWAGNGLQPLAYGGKGTGQGQFEMPAQLAVNSGHVWIADYANNRIQELNENGGGFINMFGVTGKQNGPYFERPTAVAVDPAHHLWVADAGNNRVEELSETGSFIRSVSALGAGGSLNWPSGIAVGPGNKVWVTDYGNHRIVELSETGAFLRQMGQNPSEPGGLSQPIGLAVDSHEDVWVADRALNRVVEFNGKGEYVGGFGTSGSGPGAFNSPQDIALSGNDAYVTDVENHRVQEWSIPATHSQVSTEITIEGKRTEAFEKSCEAETCSSTNEWTLQSSSLTPGTHEVVVRTTDGLGNTTSRAFNIKVGDTTKPSIELGGELPGAPGGWIQQEEGNYSFNATATDAGFGVTSLVFTIDGNAIASKTQACPAGGCAATISAAVNAKNLTAGAHTARVVATDGAKNGSTKEWTINVDPEGHVSITEAEATLEAMEEAGSTDLLGKASDGLGGIPGEESGLSIEEGEEGQLEGAGTNVPLVIGENLDEGEEMSVASEYTLAIPCEEDLQAGESPEGPYEPDEPAEEGPADEEEGRPQVDCVSMAELEEMAATEGREVADGMKHPGMTSITIIPPSAVGTGVEDVEGNAALAPNAESEVDTLIRPIMDGGFTWEEIRGAQAPEHYAFEMELDSGQELRLINEDEAAVVFKSDGVRAFTIHSTMAHDAIGTEVPTHFSVSGEVLTLTVEYRGLSPATGEPFVYPIISGTGWEGGWQSFSETIAGEPKPDEPSGGGTEGGDEATFWEHQDPSGGWTVFESAEPIVGAPIYEQVAAPKGSAHASDVGPVRAEKFFRAPWCEHYYGSFPHEQPVFEAGENGCYRTPNLKARGFIQGWFHYETSPGSSVWWKGERTGPNVGCGLDYLDPRGLWEAWEKACQFSGPNQQKGQGAHIVAKNFWRVQGYPGEFPPSDVKGTCWPYYLDLYANGNVSRNKLESEPYFFLHRTDACPWEQLEE